MSEDKAPKLNLAQTKALHALNAKFCANLPQSTRASGRYEADKADKVARERILVPDGRYRVSGSDFVLTIVGGRLREAVRADPPHFGGDNVIAVEFDAAGVIAKGD
jgi:hypothetical protein